MSIFLGQPGPVRFWAPGHPLVGIGRNFLFGYTAFIYYYMVMTMFTLNYQDLLLVITALIWLCIYTCMYEQEEYNVHTCTY